jgi:hypothetical protein
MNILSSLTSIITGGATGLLGVVAQRAFDAWNKKQALDQLKAQWNHDETMKDKDAAIMAAEWKARTAVATTEAEAAKDVAQSNAFSESLKSQAIIYSAGKPMGPVATGFLVALDFLSGIVRPALTVYLCALTTYIWLQVRALIHAEQTLDQTTVLTMWKTVIDTILYLTTTCVLWWFGTRNKQSQPNVGGYNVR